MIRNKLYIKIFFIFLLFISFFTYSFADDIYPLEDDFDISELLDSTESIETNSNSSEIPTINSRAYVVIDRKTNSVLVGKNENQKKRMASTTKIMTAMVVIENSNLSDIVEISKKSASTGGSRLGLKTGDKISVYNLLYGLMLCSGNDAAVALAEYVSGSVTDFATLMNQKASDLGLSSTHFVTPHGLDEDEHYTTAYELAILANYALENEIFANIVKTKTYTININGYPKTLSNTNELLGNLNGVYGVKTGFTNGANRCLVTSCKRGEMDIICVVLGADTKKYRTQDSIKLIEYYFNNFTYVNIEEKISEAFELWKTNNINYLEINKSSSNYINLKYTEPEHSIIPIRNDLIDKINISIDYNSTLEAPIEKGFSIGNIVLDVDGKIIYSGNIVFDNAVYKKNVLDYLFEFYSTFPNILSNLFY